MLNEAVHIAIINSQCSRTLETRVYRNEKVSSLNPSNPISHQVCGFHVICHGLCLFLQIPQFYATSGNLYPMNNVVSLNVKPIIRLIRDRPGLSETRMSIYLLSNATFNSIVLFRRECKFVFFQVGMSHL